MATTSTNEHECTIAEAAILLQLLTDNGDPVMLWGPPGLGKSDIVRQLGKATSTQGDRLPDQHQGTGRHARRAGAGRSHGHDAAGSSPTSFPRSSATASSASSSPTRSTPARLR